MKGLSGSEGPGSVSVEAIRANLTKVRERIGAATARSGRSADEVRLVAVTKTVPTDIASLGIAAGLTDLGENRVQEARAKHRDLADRHPEVRWHLIGHLQTNKAGLSAETFDLIHSLDSPRLARALDAAAERRPGGPADIDVLVQVNVAGEESKFGVPPAAAEGLVRLASGLPRLRVRGLMTIAPLSDDPEEVRPVFRALARLAREIERLGLPGVSMDLLSMGMSQDYEVAVEEGANLIRLGTAIFGPRPG